MINPDNLKPPVRTITHERKQPPNLTKIKIKRTQESTGEQAIKDLTAAAALEKEKKKVVVLAITRVEVIDSSKCLRRLCFARIKSAFEMNNIQRANVTLLRGLWLTKLHFARLRKRAVGWEFLEGLLGIGT